MIIWRVVTTGKRRLTNAVWPLSGSSMRSRDHLVEPLKGVLKPGDLSSIYGTHPDAIGRMRGYGIRPDYAIRNLQNERVVFVEVKRQDPKENAHERACRYMMPGILAAMQEIGGHPPDIIPMWWVFTNGLAEAPRYAREITYWFRGLEPNVLLWGDSRADVTEHFDRFIRPMLEE